MKIIILGAGQVGATLAETLAIEDNDITLIDINAERLRELQNRIDIRTVVGPASYPEVLERAGAMDADMLIAVTSNDETNMIACQVGYTIFHIPTKIVRIRSRQYFSHPELFCPEALPIDVFISPEELVTDYVSGLIEYPGALQVLDFAGGIVQLVAIVPDKQGMVVGKSLAELKNLLPDTEARIAAIYRDNRSISLSSDTNIEVGDEIFFIASRSNIRKVMNVLGRKDSPNRRIMIAGGGNIGFCLAKTLEQRYQVKVLEHNTERSQQISELLNNSTVLLGEAAERDLLIDENIESVDVFCAVTNDDEANIMSALLAKRLGARTVMALITRTTYADLIEGSDIDIAISPQQVSVGSILTHLRRGDIVKVYSLRRGAAEAIEAIAHGDKKTSKVVGRTLDQIKLPRGCTIGAIVRGEQAIIARKETTIEADDHVILFVEDKKRIGEVEKLFQVSATFF